MKKTALIALLFTGVLTGCINGLKSITGSGNVVTQNRNVGTFTKIDAGNGVTLTIEQSNVTEVAVEADDNIQEHIKTTLSGSTLVIESDYNSFENATMNIKIKMPTLEALKTSGGVSAKGTGIINGKKIKLESSSGSSIDLQVEVEEVTGESSSGSTLVLTGKALEADLSASSGSSIEADKMLVNKVTADASSGSSILIQPLISIDGKASSGGSVKYVGSPKEVKRDESSGGSVSGN